MQLLLALLLTTSPKAGLPIELPLPSEARKYQHAPAVRLMYQWDEETPESPPDNKEAWTNFVLQRKLMIPTEMLMSDKPAPLWNEGRFLVGTQLSILRQMELGFECHIRLHSPWLAAIDCRMPSFHSVKMLVRYTVHQEPSGLNQYYSGSVDSVPHLTARAKTIEVLEAKLLEMYSDYVTKLLEEDLQPEVSPPPDTQPGIMIANYLPLYDIIHEPSFIRPYYLAAFSLRPNIQAMGVNIDQLETRLLGESNKDLDRRTGAQPLNEGTARDR